MKPKTLREFEYRGYRVVIQGYYEDQPPWGKYVYYRENGKKKMHRGVVYMPFFIYKSEGNTLTSKLLLNDIKEWTAHDHMAHFDVKKTGKWFNRKKEIVHIKDDLKNKLNKIEIKLRKTIDKWHKEDDIKAYFQEMTEGLPDSLDKL